MRPVLAALAEQQAQIDVLNGKVASQTEGLTHLARGLQTLATMAGVEKQVASAMLKRADVQNPAQPVPEPPAVPATQSTEEVKTPEAFANVQTPGMVPGSTNDVAADATTTVYTPGQDIPGPPFKNLIDVTAPVDGTQGPRPLSEVKTETDVRVGDPMKPDVAFPLRGPWQNAQRTSSADRSNRTMASLRLAKLHIQAGLSEETDEYVAAAGIEKDASRSVEDIEREIGLLGQVHKAAAKRTQPPTSLVPRTASGVQRTVPSMQNAPIQRGASVELDDDASDLFVDF